MERCPAPPGSAQADRGEAPHGRWAPVEASYVLGHPLGDGSFATVCRCRQRLGGGAFACKSISKARGQAAACATNEIWLLHVLNDQGFYGPGRELIVQLVDTFEDDRSIHLILNLCHGGELFLRQSEVGIFPEPDAKVLVLQMLLAVHHLHSFRVVHRDLKLENWLLCRAAPCLALQLCDFGLSVLLEPGEMAIGSAGSIYYLAPEVLTGEYDTQADMWSMGVIIFMLLSGAPPFDGEDAATITKRSALGEVSYSDPATQPIRSEARALIRRLLALKPEERVSAAGALASAWLVGTALPPAPASPRQGDVGGLA